MGTPTAIGVDDDFAACQASIALGAANDELAGWIDVQVSEITVLAQSRLAVLQSDRRQSLLHHLLYDELVHGLHARSSGIRSSVASNLLATSRLEGLGMLRRDNHSVNLLRLYRSVLTLQILDAQK